MRALYRSILTCQHLRPAGSSNITSMMFGDPARPLPCPGQIADAPKLIASGEERQDVADLFKVSRTTLYRALANV